MSLTQMTHFFQDVFQMTAITLLSVTYHYHINGLYRFWDTLQTYLFNFDKGIKIRDKKMSLGVENRQHQNSVNLKVISFYSVWVFHTSSY